jgi:putative PIN family toxin of toxin-antitoxin system
MKIVIFDTNVLLDLFIFNDFRVLHIKQALIERQLDALASQQTLAEFTEVISRPLFSLDQSAQEKIVQEWQSLAHMIDENKIIAAPWQCRDNDDQIFLDLAYTGKPCVLLSKDNEVLKLASRAANEGILITADYTSL